MREFEAERKDKARVQVDDEVGGVGGVIGGGGDEEVLTGDVIAEDPRRDDVATGAEQPFQVRLVDIMRIVLAISQLGTF